MQTVGILGGGQLARMMALSGAPLGLRFRVLDNVADACAGQFAPMIVGDYTDEAALAYALPSEAAYVGVLGARRRIPERLARLADLGVPEGALERLKAPIGLDLGGKAPFEIAVAVMAEIVADWSARQDHDRAT